MTSQRSTAPTPTGSAVSPTAGSRFLTKLVHANKAGHRKGITSVCSAHPLVLKAAVLHGAETNGHVLIEATSNQVDQDGGYTGMRPADFRSLVLTLADEVSMPPERVILGGDHLGPNRWRDRQPTEAMAQAEVLVRHYVLAGFTKIHLDCTFSCQGDPRPLPDEVIAARAVQLISVAERAAAQTGTNIRYVIGSEVPVPGGAHETLTSITPTTPQAANATRVAHREALAAAGLSHVWPKVLALVVQPGVEFDHQQVIVFQPQAVTKLSGTLDDEPDLAFEAHSTDYQSSEALSDLVHAHWVVLKVGPELTYALREALFALDHIERELLDSQRWTCLQGVLEDRMLANPTDWANYYHGSSHEQRLLRRFSYSDRIRYYWSDPKVNTAQELLLANLSTVAIPLPLLDQYLPAQALHVRQGKLEPNPAGLVVDHVRDVLRRYDEASLEPTPLASSG